MHKKSKLRAFITSCRFEFFPATISLLFMGFFWGLNTTIDLNSAALLLTATIVLVLTNLQGIHVNMLSDYELDKKYKKFLPAAIDTLGKKTFKAIFLIECVLSFSLVLFLTVFLSKIILLVLWSIGFFIGLAYSLGPLRFKSNPVLNPISLIMVLCILPMVWVYFIFAPAITLGFSLFCGGIALGVIGLVLPTELEDFPEDKAAGVQNLTQMLGPLRSSNFSICATAASVSVASVGAGLAFLGTGAPWLWLPATLVMVIVHGFVIRKLFGLKKVCKRYENATPNEQRKLMVKIKAITDHAPQWFGSVAWSGIFAGFLLYLSKILV